jgi:hypothetical protein
MLGRALVLGLLTFSCLLFLGEGASAQRHQADRFGIRFGAWPQPHTSGDLAFIRLPSKADSVYRANVDEPSRVVPFVDLYGLFNLKGIWWAEISLGFSQRTGIEVRGIPNASGSGNPKGDTTVVPILLGQGRVDFFPMFLGLRAIHDLGGREKPHNIYARAGLSLLIASEQPSALFRDIQASLYSAGTKSAFGFLVGVGGEYYSSPRFGLTADISYRLSNLNYVKNDNFDLSSLWLSAGVILHVR